MIGAMMMLAMALEGHAAQHDHLVIAVDLAEGLAQNLVRILLVAGEIFAVGAHHAVGRLDQAVAIGVLADPLEDGAERVLGLGVGDRLAAAGGPVEILFPQRHGSSFLVRALKSAPPPFSALSIGFLKERVYPGDLGEVGHGVHRLAQFAEQSQSVESHCRIGDD